MIKQLSLLAFIAIVFSSFTHHWENNLNKAKKTAATEHKYILLNFSGSDWCGPCIRMHKEIFESESFTNFADQALVLINADFPRQKKNLLPKSLQQQNEQLADSYNPKGIFPYTVLLSADGKIIKSWEGFPKMGSELFIENIKEAIHASN